MATVLRRREVIDRGVLSAAVAALGGADSGGGAALPARILDVLKEAHGHGRAEIRLRFDENHAAFR